MKIETYIDALISYATMRELIRPEDHDVAVNKLFGNSSSWMTIPLLMNSCQGSWRKF